MRIAALGPGGVLRQFDNPIADRLLPATRQRHAHEMDVDESYRDAIGFDNRLPNFWFEVRKPLAGLPGVVIG